MLYTQSLPPPHTHTHTPDKQQWQGESPVQQEEPGQAHIEPDKREGDGERGQKRGTERGTEQLHKACKHRGSTGDLL